jgi:hypothetical protein
VFFLLSHISDTQDPGILHPNSAGGEWVQMPWAKDWLTLHSPFSGTKLQGAEPGLIDYFEQSSRTKCILTV